MHVARTMCDSEVNVEPYFELNKLYEARALFTQTHVTSLASIDELLVIAYGSTLEVRHLSEPCACARAQPFSACNVYKVCIAQSGPDQLVIAFGNRFVSVYRLHTKPKIWLETVADAVNTKEWVLEVRADEQYVYCVLALNELFVFNWKTGQTVRRINCVDRSILYTARILSIESPQNVQIAAGTVFTEILICNYGSIDCNVDQRLSGHEGVLFTIDYNDRLGRLASASDDRTVRIWQRIDHTSWTFQPLYTLFGHEARIWQVLILESCVISSGENSTIHLWSQQGELLAKRRHTDGNIWAICTDSQQKQLFLAGSDGSIETRRIVDCIANNNSDRLLNVAGVKCFKFIRIDSGLHLIVIDDQAICRLFCATDHFDLIRERDLGEPFRSYSVMAVSELQQKLVVGSGKGQLVQYDFTCEDDTLIDFGCIHKGKVFQTLYVGGRLLTNGPAGEIKIWNGSKLIACLNLQISKHSYVSCATELSNQCLAIGDRCGNIFIVGSDYQLQLYLPAVHSTNGVSYLIKVDGTRTFYSSGRDGRILQYEYDAKVGSAVRLLRVFQVATAMDWIGRLHFDRAGQLRLICGFLRNSFVVWCATTQSLIWSADCGGGNRLWDFQFTEDDFDFVYVKQNQLHFSRKQVKLRPLPFGRSKFHRDTVLSSCCLFASSPTFYVTGAEDNHVLISEFDGFESKVIDQLSGHISNVKALAVLHQKHISSGAVKAESLLITGGGRSQLMFWAVSLMADNRLRVQQLCNYFLWNTDKQKRRPWKEPKQRGIVTDPQIRFTALHCAPIKRKIDWYKVTATCTDCTLKQFVFMPDRRRVRFVQSVQLGEHCLLSLACHKDLITVGATDGHVRLLRDTEITERQMAHLDRSTEAAPASDPLLVSIEPEAIQADVACLDQPTLQSIAQFKIHQSGVNTLDSIDCSVEFDPLDHILIASGGDDSHISLTMIRLRETLAESISKCRLENVHWASVASVRLLSTRHLLSAAADHRLRLYTIDFNPLTCIPTRVFICSIPDICSMLVLNPNESADTVNVSVFGEGQEIVCIPLTDH